jgi:hypothetical protein
MKVNQERNLTFNESIPFNTANEIRPDKPSEFLFAFGVELDSVVRTARTISANFRRLSTSFGCTKSLVKHFKNTLTLTIHPSLIDFKAI